MVTVGCAQLHDRFYRLLHGFFAVRRAGDREAAGHDEGIYADAGAKVVGEVREYVVQPGEGLNEIARKFDLGYTTLAAANPGVDQFAPGVGRRLMIPSLYVPPDAPRQGIVINLAQYRFFYFPPAGDRVETFPVGLGQIGKDHAARGHASGSERGKSDMVSAALDPCRKARTPGGYSGWSR
jgi:hypothetical protein